MDLTNIKNGIGFVDRDLLFYRMSHSTPPEGEAWYFNQLPDRDFSELYISYAYYDAKNGKEMGVCYKLFQIYTGNRELYLHICSLLEDIARQFERGFKADEFK